MAAWRGGGARSLCSHFGFLWKRGELLILNSINPSANALAFPEMLVLHLDYCLLLALALLEFLRS